MTHPERRRLLADIGIDFEVWMDAPARLLADGDPADLSAKYGSLRPEDVTAVCRQVAAVIRFGLWVLDYPQDADGAIGVERLRRLVADLVAADPPNGA